MKRDKRRKVRNIRVPLHLLKVFTYKKNNEILLLEIARFEENLILFIINLVLLLEKGDPLSPFLFALVADVLSRMLLRAEERNLLEGFKVGQNSTRVSHLQYADDTIFFSNTSEEDLHTLKSLLLVFGQISGLKVNLDKSNIYGINLEQNHLSRLAELLDCKASGWPIPYLGLPLGGNPKACGFWDPVIERISRRLDG